MVVGVTTDQTCLVLKGRLRALQEAGFDVTLMASPGTDGMLFRTAQAEGVKACPIRMQRCIAPMADLRSLVQLWTLLYRIRPLITDFSTPKAGLLGNIAAWTLRVPHRVYSLRGLKLESASGFKKQLLLATERISARCAHRVFCNSESLLRKALELKIAPAEKLSMVGNGSSNGVDTNRFSPGLSQMKQMLHIPDGDWVVGFVGRLTTDKGIPELIEAFELVLRRESRCWLLLVGWFDGAEDALEEKWRRRIREHPRIRHTGYVTDVVDCYRVMDILVLPTHREGFPNVALEAAASGVPVIATESTGARDAVDPEVTGLLVPVGNVGAIADATLRLLWDPDRRKRMAEAGRRWATERYSQERVLRMTVEFYRAMAGVSARGS
jgi:glycosyltransferase involved in cell wall biosynthesis